MPRYVVAGPSDEGIDAFAFVTENKEEAFRYLHESYDWSNNMSVYQLVKICPTCKESVKTDAR